MQFHRNAKLGLAGRHQLVLAIESGGSIPQSARTFNVSVATAQSLVEAGARCRGWRRGEPLLPFRSLESSGAQSAAARARARAGDLRLSAADGLGAEARRRRERVRALDRLQGAEAAPASQPPQIAPRACATATSGPAPAISCTWTRVSTPACNGLDSASAASAAHKSATIWTASTSCTPSSTITLASPTRRSTTMRLRPTAAGFLERALAFYARPWQHRQAGADRQRLGLHPKPRLFSAPRPRARSSTSPASPTAPVATGKVERFHQTMAREWAYGLVYRSHHERADALPHWLQHY